LVTPILQADEKLHIAASCFSIETTLFETWDWISQQVLYSLVTQTYVYHFSLTHLVTLFLQAATLLRNTTLLPVILGF
jgi:hypothetical protein